MISCSSPTRPWSNAISLTASQPFLRAIAGNGPDAKAARQQARRERKQRLSAAIDVLIDPDQLRSWTNQDCGSRGLISNSEFARELRRERYRLGKLIWGHACQYNGYIATNSHAPRSSTIDKELARVEEACRSAADAIDSLGDKTIEYRHQGGPGEPWNRFCDPEYDLLYKRALGEEISGSAYSGDPDDTTHPFSRKPFLDSRLRLTAELAALARQRVRQGLGPDRGGGRNLFEAECGRPGWHLARLCYELVEEWRGKPTSTQGGFYEQFVFAVHEFATGEPGDEARGLRDRIRDGVAILGEAQRLRNKMHENNWKLTEQEERRLGQLNNALNHGRRPPSE